MHLHHIVRLYSLSHVNLSHNDTYNILNNFDRRFDNEGNKIRSSKRAQI